MTEPLTAVQFGPDAHAVYRCFGVGERLLYIGMTGNLARRLSSHSKTRWFVEVTTITLWWYPDAKSAAAAERSAIRAEQPKYNVMHKKAPRRDPAERVLRPVHPVSIQGRKARFARALAGAPSHGLRPREIQLACGLGRTLIHEMLGALVEMGAVERVTFGHYKAARSADVLAAVQQLEPGFYRRVTSARELGVPA